MLVSNVNVELKIPKKTDLSFFPTYVLLHSEPENLKIVQEQKIVNESNFVGYFNIYHFLKVTF